MTRSDRSFTAATAVVLTLAAALSTLDAAELDPTRITAAANITLRQMPSADAATVAQIPLGTEVAEAGPAGMDKTWIRVRLADGREGWLIASLTRPLDPFWRWQTFDRIVADRLSRKGDGFTSAVELVSFMDRVAGEYTDADGRARFDLNRLRALSAVLGSVPSKGDRREPYASWLASQKAIVVYDEPGRRWMLADRPIWDVHARHAATAAADDIAWFAVINGLSGECEGRLPCYLAGRDRLHGEYLRRHPDGRHAAEAVGIVKATADLLAAPGKPNTAFAFDRAADCRSVVTSIDALTRAVTTTRVADRDAALGSLAALRKVCQ